MEVTQLYRGSFARSFCRMFKNQFCLCFSREQWGTYLLQGFVWLSEMLISTWNSVLFLPNLHVVYAVLLEGSWRVQGWSVLPALGEAGTLQGLWSAWVAAVPGSGPRQHPASCLMPSGNWHKPFPSSYFHLLLMVWWWQRGTGKFMRNYLVPFCSKFCFSGLKTGSLCRQLSLQKVQGQAS